MVWKEIKTTTATTHRPAKKKKAKLSTFTPHLITLDELYNEAQRRLSIFNQFRVGQALYTAYYDTVLIKQTHADQARFAKHLQDHPDLDPFYNDKNIHNFVKFVTGKNDSNAWRVSFETLKQNTFTLTPPKVYCQTCKFRTIRFTEHYTDYRCKAIKEIEDTYLNHYETPALCQTINKNNDCKYYMSTLSLKILQWLKRIIKHD